MRRRWMTLMAAGVLGAATVVALPLPAQANWQPWTNLGGETIYSGPSVYGGMAFGRNAAGKLMMREAQGDSWGEWLQLGDLPMVGGPAAVDGQLLGRNSVEAYYRGPDNRVRYALREYLCHIGFCGWVVSGGDAGGAVSSAPAAVDLFPTYTLPSRVDLFARGANGQLQHTWKYRDNNGNGAWAGWEELGGLTFVESPSGVGWWGGNRLDVFAKGADNHLWHKWWTSNQGWTGWENLGGTLTSAPAVIRFDDTRLDVFAKGTSDSLIHKWWDAGTGWSAWEDLGSRFQYGPSVIKSGERRIDVYVTGSTAQLEHVWWG